MPVSIRQLPNGKWEVRTPNGVRAKGTTKAKALRQKALLERYEEKERRKKAALAPLNRGRNL